MSKRNPDVSVIVPVHNAEKTLKKAVGSLLAQAGVGLEIEIILAENGSTDGSLSAIRSLAVKERRIRVLSSRGKGVSEARNRGMEAAKGKYIGFLDADDYAQPDMYQTLLGIAEESDADMVICEYFIRQGNGDGRAEATDGLSGIGNDPAGILMSMVGPLEQGGTVLMGSVWRSLYRTSFIRENKLVFDTELDIGEDQMFQMDALRLAPKTRICDRPLYNYIQSETSVSGHITQDIWQKYEAFLRKMVDYGNKYAMGPEYRRRLDHKIMGLSGWIAASYAKCGMPMAERYRLVKAVGDARSGLLSQEAPISADKTGRALDAHRYYEIILRGMLLKLRKKLFGS